MEYANTEQRKSKRQLKKKRAYRIYKRGGHFRTSACQKSKISEHTEKENSFSSAKTK